jgi:serine/threonine protein kinase
MSERAIFIAALEKDDPVERAAFLDQACADDRLLRQRIERLLKAHEPADSFLEHRPPCLGGTVDEQPLTEQPGTVIGPYKLLQQIGEGGMGIVFMAEQQHPVRRKVALKIIKPGMDSAQVIARFEAERQALALMDHQNIAKVFDAGTTENGRPYFVMELVHGVPITQYCDDHHLTPRARLELVLPVCHAIQHAHQKGIIHRDLKPANVLVCLYDGVPVPKVIDFGIAKATAQQLTDRTMFTQFGTLVGTLEYMSPEQAEMSQLGVDTRSDIYSLGVLLYELLTGTTPLERNRLREAGFDEIRRLIREEEPPKPSTRLSTSGVALAAISEQRQTEPAKLTKLVRGELDWIVMKALEKDRTRRYETANDLARDVARYLQDEPVEACPPTAGYRLRKFARKNKKLLATAAAFAALLLLGVVVSSWQAVRATQAEAMAIVNEQEAKANAVQAQEKEQEANQQRNEAQKQRDEVRVLNEKLQRTLYAAHMNLAQRAWEAGGVERVEELLELHCPKPGETDLRRFEWHYLNRLCHPELLTLKGHTGGFPGGPSVAFSPDGKRVANASFDQTVKVRDAQTGQELLSLQGHTSWVYSVAYSADGKRLASASEDTTVKVWDAQTGQELLSLKGHADVVTSVTFSPDGKRLASAGDQVKVWDVPTGQQLLSFQGPLAQINSVAFSPDGKRLACAHIAPGNRSELKVWDAKSGQELLTYKTRAGTFINVGVYGPGLPIDGQAPISAE